MTAEFHTPNSELDEAQQSVPYNQLSSCRQLDPALLSVLHKLCHIDP
jgi:hypothetical protein